MEVSLVVTSCVAAGAVGALLGYLVARTRAVRAEARAEFLTERVAALEGEAAASRLEANGQREQRAEAVVPVKQALGRLDAKLDELARERVGSFRSVADGLRTLSDETASLQRTTGRLAQALRTPNVRGRWGEMQLRRVVELAGMVAHCDFDVQVRVEAGGSVQRPDMVVHLPGGTQVVVDAKVPLDAYLAAIDEGDEGARRNLLADHAKRLRAHVQSLGRKAYWQQFPEAPAFVVLFLPAEPFLVAALEHEPTLLEYAVDQSVVVATPMTLIALLRAVASGWQHEAVERHAGEIRALGAELYRRLVDMSSRLTAVGRGLERTVGAFNAAVGAYESQVLTAARRFDEMAAAPTAERLEGCPGISVAVRPCTVESSGTTEEEPIE